MTYRTTRRCDLDIIDIYARGAAMFGLSQAERYHQRLLATFDLLSDYPRMGRERSEFKPPVRLHAYRAHMIVYLIEEKDNILIVRVLHGRQDWERHLA